MNNLLRQISRDSYVGGVLMSNALYHRGFSSPSFQSQQLSSGPGTVLIVGGELFYKGAQAMTYTVVSELRDRFPQKNIYLMSTRDFNRPVEERDRYTFEILPWSPNIRLSCLHGGKPLKGDIDQTDSTLNRIYEVVGSAECIIDINGYALSSQRGTRRSLLYILNIMIARDRGIPFYIFPQSIGPFDYDFPESSVMKFMLGTYLSYPEWIFPREESGVNAVASYRNNNTRRELDLVLTHDYGLENIFTNTPDDDFSKIPNGGVGIVPNMRVAERMSDDEFKSLYERILESLYELDHHPVVIQHSTEDEELCDIITNLAENQVTTITGDREPFELERIISNLDFLIGSRYHSIVHSYKQSVPAIIIGWAEKYRALAKEFGQSDSVFDVRETSDHTSVVKKITEKSSSYKSDSDELSDQLKRVRRKESLFDVIQG